MQTFLHLEEKEPVEERNERYEKGREWEGDEFYLKIIESPPSYEAMRTDPICHRKVLRQTGRECLSDDGPYFLFEEGKTMNTLLAENEKNERDIPEESSTF